MLGRCVLRMDHYCVWVANSVGLLNYKAFLLFLLYTFLACALGASMLLGDVARFFKGIDTAGPENAGRCGQNSPLAAHGIAQAYLMIVALCLHAGADDAILHLQVGWVPSCSQPLWHCRGASLIFSFK